jgi:hypothetical protein
MPLLLKNEHASSSALLTTLGVSLDICFLAAQCVPAAHHCSAPPATSSTGTLQHQQQHAPPFCTTNLPDLHNATSQHHHHHAPAICPVSPLLQAPVMIPATSVPCAACQCCLHINSTATAYNCNLHCIPAPALPGMTQLLHCHHHHKHCIPVICTMLPLLHPRPPMMPATSC